MKVLELFSGTGSVSKCCKALGWDVVSVDMILPADHQVDIMDFDYKQYSKDEFDIVWASPPCTYYSALQNCWIGRKKKDGILVTRELIEQQRKESDKLVLKSFEIIDYFNPYYWFLENPQTGALKNREIMKDKPFYDVSYCMYSDWGYEKKTRIWTNKKDWNNLICDKSGACGNMNIFNKHNIRIDGCSKWVNVNGKIINCSNVKLKEKYKDYPNVKPQHNKVLGNGYEMIDGKKVLCNTKELRNKHKVLLDKVGCGSQLNQPKDLKCLGNGTNRIDRYRVPEDLIFSLFLD
jgi:hypothetical protein